MSILESYKNRFNLLYSDACSTTKAEQEKHFNLFLENYPATFSITSGNSSFDGAIISEKDSLMQEIVYILLTKLANTIPKGTIVPDPNGTNWIIFNNSKYCGGGYNRYKIIECNSELNWLDEYGVEKTSPCYMQGSLKGTLKARIAGTDIRVPEPNGTLLVIMPVQKFPKKTRFIINDQAWKIAGFDSISFSGLMFLSLSEDVIDTQNDNLVDDIAENDGDVYSIDLVNTAYTAVVGEIFTPIYTVMKNNVPVNLPCTITVSNTKATVANGAVTCVTAGTVNCTVTLDNNAEIKQVCALTIVASRVTDNEDAYISGARSIKWGRTQTYTPAHYINNVPQSTPFTYTITGDSDLVTSSKVGSLINITAAPSTEIGTITLTVTFTDGLVVATDIDVISLWG